MDWLTFISSLIGNLAWPLTVIIAVIILRKPLGKLLPQIKKFQYKDLNLEFGELEKRAEAILPLESEKLIEHTIVPITALREIADISPRAAIMEAWRSVEYELKEAAKRMNLQDIKQGNIKRFIDQFRKAEIISGPIAVLLHDLRALRNDAVHASEIEISNTSTEQYIITANNLCNYLKSINR